eukprot:g1129.t1
MDGVIEKNEGEEEEDPVDIVEKARWVPDEARSRCMQCDQSFSLFRGKHHCRFCGDIFCGDCSSRKMSSPRKDAKRRFRVCDKCYVSAGVATGRTSPRKDGRGSSRRNRPSDIASTNKSTSSPPTTPTGTAFDTNGVNRSDTANGVRSAKRRFDVKRHFSDLEAWCNDLSRWSFASDSKGLRRYSALTNELGFAGARGEIIVDAPSKVVFSFLRNLDRRKEYDELFEGYTDFERIDANTFVTQIKTTGKWPATGRDFCVLRHYREISSGKYATFQTSVVHDRCPPGVVKKYVRGEVRSFAVVDSIDQGRRAHVTVAMAVNLNGNLPTWLIRYVITQQLDALSAQKKWIESQDLSSSPLTPIVMEGASKDAATKTDETKKQPATSFRVLSVVVVNWWDGKRREVTVSSPSSSDNVRVALGAVDPAASVEIAITRASGVVMRGKVTASSLLLTQHTETRVPLFVTTKGSRCGPSKRAVALVVTAKSRQLEKPSHAVVIERHWKSVAFPAILALIALVMAVKRWKHLLSFRVVAALLGTVGATGLVAKRVLACGAQQSRRDKCVVLDIECLKIVDEVRATSAPSKTTTTRGTPNKTTATTRSPSSSDAKQHDRSSDGKTATLESPNPLSKLPPRVADVVNRAVRTIASMAGAKGSKAYCKWAPFGSNGHVKYFMAESFDKKGVAIKGILPFVPVSPAAIVTILGLPEEDPRKQRLSPDADESNVVRRHDNHTVIKYQRNKAIWPTAAREMVMVVHIRKMQDGNVVVAAKSIRSDAAPPVDSKYVRMHIESAGWFLEPVEDKTGGRGTRATYVNHFDPMGGIPTWVVKKGSSKNLSQVATLRDVINERLGEYVKIPPLQNETFEICSELAPAKKEEEHVVALAEAETAAPTTKESALDAKETKDESPAVAAPRPTFSEAAEMVKSFSGVGTDDLLKLYGLFKCATKGPCTGSRPGMFDVKGRAKYDAWKSISDAGKDSDQYREAYISLVLRLKEDATAPS